MHIYIFSAQLIANVVKDLMRMSQHEQSPCMKIKITG